MINLQKINEQIAELEEKLDMLHAARREFINRGNLNKATMLENWHVFEGHTGFKHYNGSTKSHPILADGHWISIIPKEELTDETGKVIGVISSNGQVYHLGNKFGEGSASDKNDVQIDWSGSVY